MSLCELFGPKFCPLFGIIVREFYSAEDLGFLDRICGIIERLARGCASANSGTLGTCADLHEKTTSRQFTVAAIPRLALHHLFSYDLALS